MVEPTREEVAAAIQQIDVDIKDEAEAHKHYKELTEEYRRRYLDSQDSAAAAIWYESYTSYEAMSQQEGEHLQRLLRIRTALIDKYM